MDIEPSVEPSGFQNISEDVVGMISTFLSFADMAAASQCARSWYYFGRREIFKRNLERRWCYQPTDFGMGESPGLYAGGMTWNHWKKRILAREEIEKAMKVASRETGTVRMKIKKMSMFVIQQADTPSKVMVYTMEGCRWLVEWFDAVQSRNINNSFLTPEVRGEFLRFISVVMMENKDTLWIQHLGAKATGVLAISEKNREKMIKCGNVKSLADALKFFCSEENWMKQKANLIIPNILWALVVSCRPMGGQEGEPYMRDDDEQFENIRVLSDLQTINLGRFHEHRICLLIDLFKIWQIYRQFPTNFLSTSPSMVLL